MSEMRISIRLFDASKSHSILIVDGFLAAIVQTWNLDSTKQYLLYSLDLQGILHNEKTWKENGVVSGDSFVLLEWEEK